MISIKQVDATSIKVYSQDFGVEQEISDFFKFLAPGYKFMPAYRKGIWDGFVRLFDSRTKKLPAGLLSVLTSFLDTQGYEYTVDAVQTISDVNEKEIQTFISNLNLHARGQPIELRDYQVSAIVKSITNNRLILIAPTSSGKSAMIYCKIRWVLAQDPNARILLVVPSTQLVEQMFSDFEDYSTANGWNVPDKVQKLYSGKDKVFSKSVLISTWQSLNAMLRQKSINFKEIVELTTHAIYDEAHTQKSTEVLKTMNAFVNTYNRMGTTGTLDGTKVNELTLVGLMGPTFQVITTKKLMDQGHVVNLKIQAIVLQHKEEIRKQLKGISWQEEVNFLTSFQPRNNFIAKLALNVKGTTLILFNLVERHGKLIFDAINAANNNPDRKVYFITGATPTEEREKIRKAVETEENSIIVATSSIMSTGTNIPSIENIIFAFGGKSTIRIRQSIGRGLRLKSGKNYCTLFDLSDDLTYKKFRNITLNQMAERLKVYDQEQFEYKIVKLPI